MFFVQVYVDDLGLAAKCKVQLAEFKAAMHREFRMKELGETTYYLGIHFIHHPQTRTIHLHQERYILQLLKTFNMEDCKPVRTPMEENHSLTEVEALKPGKKRR